MQVRLKYSTKFKKESEWKRCDQLRNKLDYYREFEASTLCFFQEVYQLPNIDYPFTIIFIEVFV